MKALSPTIIRIFFALLLVWCGFTEDIRWFALLFVTMWVAGDWFSPRGGLDRVPDVADSLEIRK